MTPTPEAVAELQSKLTRKTGAGRDAEALMYEAAAMLSELSRQLAERDAALNHMDVLLLAMHPEMAGRIKRAEAEVKTLREENANLLRAMQDEGLDVSDATIDAAIKAIKE
jgi:hypothetical protein